MYFEFTIVVLDALLYTAPPRIAALLIKSVSFKVFRVPLTYTAPPRIAWFPSKNTSIISVS